LIETKKNFPATLPPAFAFLTIYQNKSTAMSSLTFHRVAIQPMIYSLKNAHAFITKGYKHAQTQNIDPNDFLTARLHPDMQDFRYQVYRFTDIAKFTPPRLNPALESITIPDEEQTFPELLARIDRTIKYMEGFKESDFEGQEGREVVVKIRNETMQIKLSALDHVVQMAHPNFW
jgi:hypothetical protein